MEGSSLCLTPDFLPIGGSDLGGYVSMHKDTSMVYPSSCLPYSHSLALSQAQVCLYGNGCFEENIPKEKAQSGPIGKDGWGIRG